MKKKFTFLMAALMLLTMFAIPMGMRGQRTTNTYSLTPDQSSTGSSATSYITTLTEFTYDKVSWKMNQWNPSTLQVKCNQASAASEFRFYNTSAFSGRITQVVITFSALTVSDASKLMFRGGTSEVSATSGGTAGTWNSSAKTLTWTPGNSDNFTYFAFYQDGKAASGTNYLAESDAIVVTYETGGGSTVATPTFSPAAGAVVSGTTVTISCATEGATIYYTIDGTDPNTSSSVYTTPITLTTATTIKAYAVKDGYIDSDIATAEYTIATPVATPTFSPAAGTYTTNQDVTISCATDGATIYYTTNGSDPTTSSTEYSSAINVSTNTTIKAIAVKVGMINSGIATADYTFAATLPFSFDNGKVAIATTKGLTQSGLGSDYANSPKLKFDDTGDYMILNINERPGTLTFDIKGNTFYGGTFKVQTSADGETFTDLKSYSTINNSNAQNESFNNLDASVRYIKWIYTNKSSGNVALGNIALAAYIAPTGPTVNSGTLTHVSISGLWNGDTFDDINLGDEVEENTKVYFSLEVEEGYTLESVSVLDADYEEVELTEASGSWWFTMPDSNVTINATATPNPVSGDEYKLYSGALIEGDYLIVYDGKAMNNTVSSDRLQYNAVTISEGTITTDDADIVWHIAPSGDYWTIYNADANAYAAGTGVNNKAQMLGDNTDDKALWTVSGTETFEFVNKYNSASNKNANLRNNGTYGFACYATGTGGALSLYKKVETFTLDIAQYTDQFEGWYLIASPVTVTLENNPMVPSNNYDLYRFNPAAENEWENYRANDNNEPLHPDFTTLEVGRGYLYANGNDGGIQLSFTGAPASNGEVTVPNAGWNLVGNPLNTAATITNSYYRINENHTGIMAGTGNIAVMEGIFVNTTAASQKVVFSIPEPGKSRNSNALVINLNRNDNVIDRAIVRFGESAKLSKFQLFEGSTKIYIPQNGADYAIAAMDDNTQAFSLNFHAKTTGKYTLSLGETSNLSYVHIFDRMTGEDVDMLLEDSYSFIGSPADSEERFIVRLNYNASPTDSETFAYQSGNGIIVNGEGELQIFDVTGRKVMTTTINGVQTVNGLNNGLYIFKLNEKTQKIVVR